MGNSFIWGQTPSQNINTATKICASFQYVCCKWSVNKRVKEYHILMEMKQWEHPLYRVWMSTVQTWTHAAGLNALQYSRTLRLSVPDAYENNKKNIFMTFYYQNVSVFIDHRWMNSKALKLLITIHFIYSQKHQGKQSLITVWQMKANFCIN